VWQTAKKPQGPNMGEFSRILRGPNHPLTSETRKRGHKKVHLGGGRPGRKDQNKLEGLHAAKPMNLKKKRKWKLTNPW